MLALAVLSLVQAQLFQFQLGPVQFNLGLDKKWELSVEADDADIELDSLVIRSKKLGGGWSTGILPFKGQGLLADKKLSEKVKLLHWPPEWLGACALRVEFVCRRPGYLWHERVREVPLETPYEEGGFNGEVGQRFILIPDNGPPPRLTASNGEAVEVADLAYKVLKLQKAEGTRYEFKVEETNAVLTFESPLPPLTHPWFDAIVSQHRSHHQNVWLPWYGLAFMDREESSILKGKPATLKGVYSIAKPRRAFATIWEWENDLERLSLQPGLAVLEVGEGKAKKTKAILFPSASYWQTMLRSFGPGEEFKGLEKMVPSLIARRASVGKGMTQGQVWWIMGPPLQEAPLGQLDSVWTYRSNPPGHTITFKNGKVSEVFIGRLP